MVGALLLFNELKLLPVTTCRGSLVTFMSWVFQVLVLAGIAHVSVFAVQTYPVGPSRDLSSAQLTCLATVSPLGTAIELVDVIDLSELFFL